MSFNYKIVIMSSSSPSDVIKCVELRSGWRTISISRAQHAEFLARAEEAKVPKMFGVPIVACKLDPVAGGDNQPATWLMIEPSNGFAPMHWQGDLGTVLALRADGESYEASDHKYVHDFISDLLDRFGEPTPPGPRQMGVKAFQSFLRSRIGEEEMSQRLTVFFPRVRLIGLTKADLNGKEGFKGRLLRERGRFIIYLDEGKVVLAKEENCQELP